MGWYVIEVAGFEIDLGNQHEEADADEGSIPTVEEDGSRMTTRLLLDRHWGRRTNPT